MKPMPNVFLEVGWFWGPSETLGRGQPQGQVVIDLGVGVAPSMQEMNIIMDAARKAYADCVTKRILSQS